MATGKEGALSGREIEVLWLTAWGFTGVEIAARMGISDKTVTTYRQRGLKKLEIGSRVDIIRYALANKWLEVDPRDIRSIVPGK